MLLGGGGGGHFVCISGICNGFKIFDVIEKTECSVYLFKSDFLAELVIANFSWVYKFSKIPA